MDDDSSDESTGCPALVWKEPIDGKTAFFTEEVYRQLAGPEPTLEEQASQMMDALGFPPPRLTKQLKSDRSDSFFNRHGARRSYSSSTQVDSFHYNAGSSRQKTDSSLQREPATKNENKLAHDCKKDVCLDTSPSVDASVSTDCQQDFKENELVKHGMVSEMSKPNVVSEPAQSESLSGSRSTPAPGVASRAAPSEAKPTQRNSRMRAQTPHNSGFGLMGESAFLPERSSREPGLAGHHQHLGHRAKMFQAGRRPPVPEARESSLSHDQHIRYLDLFKKCTQRFLSGSMPPPSDRDLQELREFEALQMMVGKEQEECQEYLKQVALHSPFLYTSLPPHVSKYTQDKEQSSWKRAESYCRYYSSHSKLPLTMAIPPPMSSPLLPALKLVQTVLEVGSKCKLIMPDNNPNPNARLNRTVSTELQKIIHRFPSVPASDSHSWNHEPASKDSNLERLVHKYPCHVATSASVLQQLIDNHSPDFSTVWDIPVVIKEYGNKSASRKVVYLDKPLLPKGLSLCQKKTKYLQKAVRAFLCQPHNERGKNRNVRGQSYGESVPEPLGSGVGHSRALNKDEDNENPFGETVSMDDLETFGSDKFSQNTKKLSSTKLSGNCVNKKGSAEGNVMYSNFIKAGQFFLCDNTSNTRLSELQNESGIQNTGSGSSIASETKSEEKIKTKVEDSAELQPLDKEKSSDRSSASQTKRCLRSSVLCDQDASSDSEENALVIAESCSPNKSPQKASQASHCMLRRSQDSVSVADELPMSAAPVVSESDSQSQFEEPSPRRLTRSVSLKLQSPDSEDRPIPTSSISQSTASGPDQLSISVASDGSASTLTTRMTRQALKRKVSESEQTVSETKNPPLHEASSSARKIKKQQVETERSDCGKSEEEAGAVCHTDSAKKQTKKNENQGMKKSAGSESASYLDSILKEMSLPGESTHVRMQEDPSQYQQPGCTGEHIGYHLWDLSGVGLIVRCNSHSFIRDMRQQQTAVYVRAKPERQVHHGLEQSTLSECIRGWFGCYLRPNSYLLRVRVNMQNNEIVHTEELQLNNILQPSFNFSPQCAFAVLRNILSTLTSLPAGSYLLSHESGADHVQLKAGSGSRRGGYDFRSHYLGLVMKEPDKTVPWIPVDPTLILPHHWRMGLIPATFQPADFDSKRKRQQQFAGPKKKNRYRKKKSN